MNIKINEKAQRIAIIAISIFSLVTLAYWIFKNSSVIFANQPQIHATLASEIECAKQDFLDRNYFNDSDFNDTESAKLFLTIKHGEHGGNVFSKTFIMPQDVNKERILEHFNTLINDIQADIIFNSTSNTIVKIGILAKGKDYLGKPTFSYMLFAHSTAHHGETFNTGYQSFTEVFASDSIQNGFCDLMEINRAPQIDSQGNFI